MPAFVRVQLTKYAQSLLQQLERHLQAEASDVVEEAIIKLYEIYVASGEIKADDPTSLAESLEDAGLLKNLYKCTRKALSETEENAIQWIDADSEEEAWQQMAIQFPNEVSIGFLIEQQDLNPS